MGKLYTYVNWKELYVNNLLNLEGRPIILFLISEYCKVQAITLLLPHVWSAIHF
jgi:hypothetical protein